MRLEEYLIVFWRLRLDQLQFIGGEREDFFYFLFFYFP